MIDVLVPVLGRPGNVQPLVDSLAVTDAPYRLIFICSPHDHAQIAACREMDAETWIVDWHPGAGDFAKKINWAFPQCSGEWVFQGADDLRFQPGWDSQALLTARKQRRRVIGTNDLHNPSVKRQLSSTHTLFARSYIEEHGGTEDGSGLVFSEAYDHQFVDTEFVEVARRRREWAFCRHSVVEHLHPHWGNADWDDTYRKAIRHTNADHKLFRQRMGLSLRNGRAERIRRRQEERMAVAEQRRKSR